MLLLKHCIFLSPTGLVSYELELVGTDASTSLEVKILDKRGDVVALSVEAAGTLIVEDAQLWWPYLMDPNPGYLYTLEVRKLLKVCLEFQKH